MPSFGEIYQRHNSSSSRAHQQFESSNQFNRQAKSPIIEMPTTPDSTMGRKRFFSSSSSTAGAYNNNLASSSSNKAAYSSGYNSFSQGGGGYTAASTATSTSGIGGPHNTVLSPTPIFVNHDSVCSSSSTQKTFEPIAKQSHNYASSSSKTVTNSTNNLGYNKSHSSVSLQPTQIMKSHGFNKEEEDEEIFSLGGPNQNMIDSDKQFRPIYHPVITETNAFGSTRTTPITVTNMSNNKNKRNNYSTSSYEYSESHGGNQQNPKWQNGHQQRFNSTQTIAN